MLAALLAEVGVAVAPELSAAEAAAAAEYAGRPASDESTCTSCRTLKGRPISSSFSAALGAAAEGGAPAERRISRAWEERSEEAKSSNPSKPHGGYLESETRRLPPPLRSEGLVVRRICRAFKVAGLAGFPGAVNLLDGITAVLS